MTAERIDFGHGNRATVVRPEGGDAPQDLLRALGLGDEARPVVVVCGDAAGGDAEAASRLLGPAVAAAAARTGARVVDGGTDAGVMAAMGRARAEHPGAIDVLLGVAPAGRVRPAGDAREGEAPLEPHHTHFALADSDRWGAETRLLADLASALAAGSPVVVVVAGGGDVTRDEVVEAGRRGWPVFLLPRTGGTAARIAALWRRHREGELRPAARLLPAGLRRRPPRPLSGVGDPQLREILRGTDLRLFDGDDPRALGARIAWELQDDPALKAAWRRFATFDALASRLRRSFERFQAAVLLLGISAALAALLHDATGGAVLHWAAVVLPILVSVLVALATRRAAGKRWVALRGAAEAIKSEIYRHRTRTGRHADAATRGAALLEAVDAVVEGIVGTEATFGPLEPYDGALPPAMYGAAAGDDGLSDLGPDDYLRLRVGDQLAYYHGRVRRLDRRRSQLQAVTIGSGGAGAILAAAGAEPWIGLTTTIAAAGMGYLATLQVDATVATYNQTAIRLESLRDGWDAVPPARRAPDAASRLVDRAERLLGGEVGGWVQQMTESVADLQDPRAAPTAAGVSAGSGT